MGVVENHAGVVTKGADRSADLETFRGKCNTKTGNVLAHFINGIWKPKIYN